MAPRPFKITVWLAYTSLRQRRCRLRLWAVLPGLPGPRGRAQPFRSSSRTWPAGRAFRVVISTHTMKTGSRGKRKKKLFLVTRRAYVYVMLLPSMWWPPRNMFVAVAMVRPNIYKSHNNQLLNQRLKCAPMNWALECVWEISSPRDCMVP